MLAINLPLGDREATVAKAFKESFSSMQEINTATPEQVGVALVLHMQTEGNRFSPHNFQGNINNLGAPTDCDHRLRLIATRHSD
jgi:hypothetical protein